MSRKPKPPRYCGPFVPDPDLKPHPKDHEQRDTCRNCHRLGRPGDAAHTLPAIAPPTGPDHGQRAAGEKTEGSS